MNKLLSLLNIKSENSRIVFRNVIGAFLVKGGGLIISLFTMPAYMRYFEDQRILGLWFTILSVLTWILSFDLGVGNGLRNKLVEAITKDDRKEIKKYISSAYFVVGAFIAVVLVIGYVLLPFINLNAVFKVDKNIISEEVMLISVRYIFTGIAIQFLLRLITSILYALQKSAFNNFLQLLTKISLLLFVILAPSSTAAKNLEVLSMANIILVNLPLFIATVVVFSTKLKGCLPNIKYYGKVYAYSVLKLGGIFFWCQIVYMIIMNTNEFFISQYSGTEYVVEYQIYFRLFTLVGMLFSLSLTPIWSAITKAISENNYDWLSKLYIKLKKIALVSIGLEFLFIPFLQTVVNIWLKDKSININYAYATWFALFGGVFIYSSVLSTVVCGIGRMKLQAVSYTIGVIAKIFIIHFGMQIFNSWIVVLVSNIIVLLPYCVLQQISLNKYIKLKKAE